MNTTNSTPCSGHVIGSLIYHRHPTEDYTFNCMFSNFLKVNKNKVLEYLLENINPLSISSPGDSIKNPFKLCNRRNTILNQCKKFNIFTIEELINLDRLTYNSFFKYKHSILWIYLLETMFINRGLRFSFSKYSEYVEKYTVKHLNDTLGLDDPWYLKKCEYISEFRETDCIMYDYI